MLPNSLSSPDQATKSLLIIYRKSFIFFCRFLKKIGLYNRISLHLILLSLIAYGCMSSLFGYSNFSIVDRYQLILILPLSLAWQSVLSYSQNFRFRLYSFMLAVPLFIYVLADKNNLHPGIIFDICSLILLFFIFAKLKQASLWKQAVIFSAFIFAYSIFSYFFQTYFVISYFSNLRPLMFLSILPFLFAQAPKNTFFVTTHFINFLNTSPLKNFNLVRAANLNANRGIFLIYLVLIHIVLFTINYDFILNHLPSPLFYYGKLYVISYCAGNIPIAFFRLNRLKAFDAFHFPILATSLQSHWQRWNRNYYDWLVAYIYYPVSRALRSQFISVMSVFIFTYLIHSKGSYLNIFLDRDFLLAGFPFENNELLFFMTNGLFLYLNLKAGHWKIFNGRNALGWWGTALTHSFYFSLCWLKL